MLVDPNLLRTFLVIIFLTLIIVRTIENNYFLVHTKLGYLRTAQKMKFFIKDFFSKCDQIRSFIFCAVTVVSFYKNCQENIAQNLIDVLEYLQKVISNETLKWKHYYIDILMSWQVNFFVSQIFRK